MVEKSPRDLPLYAPYVLRILAMVMKSKDIGMVEDSVPTLQTFCEHQDIATLTADQALVKQYEQIVQSYAAFASKPQGTPKSPLSPPIAIRWKSAGLKAIKSISASEATGADGGRQLSIIVPVILENLYADSDETLVSLYQKAGSEKEAGSRRRTSVNTVRTTEPAPDSTNIPVSETTAEADRVAEEEAAMLALQSLKQIFTANNRTLIRLAFTEILKFFMRKSLIARPGTATSNRSALKGNWAIKLTEMVTEWCPVQDRFIIVVTVMETLVRSPTTEDNMGNQLVLGRLIQWLLGSTINMIGLSVMDILLGLIQHVLILLQLGGKGTNVLPHHQQTSAIDLFKETAIAGYNSPSDSGPEMVEEKVSTPSAARQELLSCLQNCIANLATHIYYGDQISDILTAILLRLKPSPASGLATATAAIERPAAAAQAISDSANMKEDPTRSEFFSFGTARVTALNAVKEVLVIANKRGATVGAGAVGRNKVGVRVWEGTQWLLRDEDRRVRRAYVDALLTWMHLELNKKDLRIMEDKPRSKKNKPLGEEELKKRTSIARAASNASRGSRAQPLKTTFLQLLHLAVYDNVLEAPENDSDILLMNLLLTSLVERLGVNALKSGLPVLVRLQEDINTVLKTPKAKVNVGSLVHGYYLCLSKIFEFETTMPGYEIQSEVSRRQRAGLWMERLQFPSLALEHLIVSSVPQSALLPERTVRQGSLKRFDNVAAMVNQISIAYSNSISSAPSSPPQSPARGAISPIASPMGLRGPIEELPPAFREMLLSRWTKEACIASIEKDSARTVSPHGSRSGTTHSNNNGLLAANGHARDASPAAAVLEGQKGLCGTPVGIQTSKLRRASAQGSGPHTPVSDAENIETLRVDDLKRVLASGSLADALHSQHGRPRNGSPLRNSSTAYQDFGSDAGKDRYLGRTITRPSIISTGSESVMDAEGFESASEGDPEHALPVPQSPVSSKEIAEQYMQQLGRRSYETDGGASGRLSGAGARPESHDTANRPPSRMSRARSSSSTSAEDPEANAKALKGEFVPSVVGRGVAGGEECVPPVPPLPEGIVAKHPQSPQFQTAIAAKIKPEATGAAPAATEKVSSPTGFDGGAVGSTPLPSATSAAATLTATAPPPQPALQRERERDWSIGRNSLGNRSSVGNRSSSKSAAAAAVAGDRRTMVRALLGSIEVNVDRAGVAGIGGGAGGGGVLGKPPY